MRNLTRRLHSLLHLSPHRRMDLTRDHLITIAAQLDSTQPEEFDCNETYRLMDQFAEAVWRGEEREPWIPLIRAHLARCQDCRAEFEALMEILETSQS